MFLIDAHLDLATNAMSLNRDLTLPAREIRIREIELQLTGRPDWGKGTVALPDLRRGQIGLVIATIISRVAVRHHPINSVSLVGWSSPEQAFAHAQSQIAWYRAMEAKGEMIQIKTKKELDQHVNLWSDESVSTEFKPVGYILSLEGADSIINPEYLDWYYQEGLRAIGPAHYGPGRYAAGTNSDQSGLTMLGKELLQEMDGRGMILDATHLTDKGFFEAMDLYSGPVIASHQNCRTIVPGERQFSDEQIKILVERDAVIGGALDVWMLYPGYVRGQDPRELDVRLESLIPHFDHICQLAGNSNHIAFGTDLDGLFGREQSPWDMDTIDDIQIFQELLSRRGYQQEDIEKIFFKNWLRIFERTLPY